MRLAPKQILVNAYINLKIELMKEEIVKSINESEKNINESVPKVDIIFLGTASLKGTTVKQMSEESKVMS